MPTGKTKRPFSIYVAGKFRTAYRFRDSATERSEWLWRFHYNRGEPSEVEVRDNRDGRVVYKAGWDWERDYG